MINKNITYINTDDGGVQATNVRTSSEIPQSHDYDYFCDVFNVSAQEDADDEEEHFFV